jgi:hypothetical protein
LDERIRHSEVARQRAVARTIVGAVLGHAQRVTRNPAPVRTAVILGGARPAVVLPGWGTRYVARLAAPRPGIPKLSFGARGAFTHLRRTPAARLSTPATARFARATARLIAGRCSTRPARGATAAAGRASPDAISSRASAPCRRSSRIARRSTHGTLRA